MNQPATSCAIFLAGMALTCAAFASDINKCVAPSGTVTLTDGPCANGEDTVKVFTGLSDTPTAPATERFTVGRLPPRFIAPVGAPKPARGLALDVATLRAARLHLHLLDNAADVLRAQRVASLH